MGHAWGGGRQGDGGALVETCERCGMEARHAIWMLDDQDRPVTGMVWLRPDGTAARVLPFAWTEHRRPPGHEPLLRVQDAFPGASVGGTPPCPGSPDAW